jgi:hypothetical protein
VLEGYVPSYDATAVARLIAAGAVVVGKTNMDEFAMGSTSETSAYVTTKNPRDLTRTPGKTKTQGGGGQQGRQRGERRGVTNGPLCV